MGRKSRRRTIRHCGASLRRTGEGARPRVVRAIVLDLLSKQILDIAHLLSQ
jgi:hypothetical protein